jgi:large subunit ribosomal protein L4
MSTLKVYDTKGGAVGEMDMPDALLCLDKGEQAVHDAVVAHMAACRAGTASTLLKGEVAGSNRKPWRQKGTGRARAGYRQSPVWRGGGIVFGPRPRDYRVGLGRKVARLAFRRALSEKVQAGEVRVVDTLALSEAKTKQLVAVLKALDVGKRALLVVEKMDETLKRAARNVSAVELVQARDVGVYQLLRYPVVIVTRGGMDVLKGRLDGRTGQAS